ncbi:MAG TPA: winged helix-turn-helix domain-containing protein [Xanthobacteraceae bacterium]|nr:winged helix-turn-helix domain-containing protein [Xanthobacteraceae bacterium]
MFRFSGFELDPQRAELRAAGGAAIRLRPKTLEMLRLFAANAGRVLSKQELMEAVWPNVHVGEDSLFQCVREIRTALGDDQRKMIKLVSGRGYLFDVEVSIAQDGLTPVDGASLPAQAEPVEPGNAEVVSAFAKTRQLPFGLRGRAAVAAVAGLCAIIGLAVAAPDLIFRRPPPTIAVMPIADASNDPKGAGMAGGVTDRLIDGLAKIDNIRVVAPRSDAEATRPQQASAPSAQSDFVVRGELQRSQQSWTLQARMIKTATGEVQSVATVSVDINEPDVQLQQSRLAAGAGHPLARRLNELLLAGESPAGNNGGAKVAIEQAVASINQTTRERFGMAETMLQKALAAQPDNVDIAVALASLQLRGIQLVWFSPEDAIVAEARAGATLERALRTKPNSIPVLETYCRFLSATNRFVESLVACARILSVDPWNGGALYLIGLGQNNLGRFEDALATFRQADRFDTPQVSRWTWLLGVGWANMLMGRADDALPWLQRSIAITPASGRPQMILAAAYQQLGRTDEATAAMKEGLKLRPGTTARNVAPPMKNASPIFVEATGRIVKLMVAAGLPER